MKNQFKLLSHGLSSFLLIFMICLSTSFSFIYCDGSSTTSSSSDNADDATDNSSTASGENTPVNTSSTTVSSSTTPTPTLSVPVAPGAPSIVFGDKQLSVSWTAVNGATAYEVWYDTTNTTSPATKSGGDITGTSHTITGLTNGTTYYIYIKAKNSSGTSAFGTVASDSPTADTSISDAASLSALTLNDASKCYRLTKDIDLTAYIASGGGGYDDGKFWTPIGTYSNMFKGKFDGNGKKITGLKINRSSTDFIGLFGCLGAGAEIKNLSIVIDSGSEIIGKDYVGALAGYVNVSGATITNCNVTGGGVRGVSSVGGLIGETAASTTVTITKCYSKVLVTGTGVNHIGGLIGRFYSSGTVSECYATGSVNGGTATAVAGFVGKIDAGTLENCYSTGAVTGTGGFIGDKSGTPTITNCFWDTETSTQSTSRGVAEGKTTAEMKTQATFTSWNFTTIWNISAGSTYPFLR